MLRCCRFVLLFAVAYVVKNQSYTVAASENNVVTADEKILTKDVKKVSNEYSTLYFDSTLYTLDAIATRRSRREALETEESEVSTPITLQPLRPTEQLTKRRFNALIDKVNELHELLLSNKNEVLDSINELKKQIISGIKNDLAENLNERESRLKNLQNDTLSDIKNEISLIKHSVLKQESHLQNLKDNSLNDIKNEINLIKLNTMEQNGRTNTLSEVVNQNFQKTEQNQRQIMNDSIALRESMETCYKNLPTPTTGHPPKSRSKNSLLLDYFRQISNSKTISGIDVQLGRSSNEGVRIIQTIAGVSPGIIQKRMPKYGSYDTQWTSFVGEVITHWNDGQLVCINWWYESPLTIITNFTDTNNEDDAERRWQDLIRDGGELNKVWKKELDKIVPYLHKLQSAGVVPIFDILPTINNKYGIWRGRPGVTGSAKLYQITHDYLTKQHNLTSLIWKWSVWHANLAQFEDFWPGINYVDVGSVVMWYNKELPMSEYERLINLVGDKPLAMDRIWTVPSIELLAAQPRWTWFTTYYDALVDAKYNNASNIKATLSSTSIINKGNFLFVDIFENKN